MTDTVLADRRLETLRALSPVNAAKSPAGRQVVLNAFASNPSDIPFGLYFSARPGGTQPQVVFEGAVGLESEKIAAELTAALTPIAEQVFATGGIQSMRVQQQVPGLTAGPWPEPVERAVALPIRREGSERVGGVVILGVSPRLRFDGRYEDFQHSLAHEIASHLAEAELARQGQRVANLLETLPTPFYSTDAESRITYVNPAALTMIGVAREQLEGRRLWDLFAGIEGSPFEAFFKRVAQQKQRESMEYFFEPLKRWYFVWAYPFENGTAVVFVDVTAEVEARERVQKLAEDLSESVRARDEFMSIASHELKTPLAGLKLQTQHMERALNQEGQSAVPREKVARLLEQTSRQSIRLNRLVDDMLDVARLNAGKLTVTPHREDLCVIVRETAERMRAQFDAAQIGLEVECSGVAPADVDRDRIEQVLTNLLTNALRYGSNKPVKLVATAEKGVLRISVKDQGLGIAKADQARIFERFERAISANEVSGLGLGLYIARQIVDAHHGMIWVESEPGKGSTFHVELAVLADPAARLSQ